MSKLILLLLASMLLSSVLSAQTPVQKTKALIFFSSETNCMPCGTAAPPINSSLEKKLIATDKGYYISIKRLSHPASLNGVGVADLRNNFEQHYIPTWLINKEGELALASAIGQNGVDHEIMKRIDKFANAEASAAANFSITGNTLTVSTKAKFWVDASGQYSMAVLLTEEHIWAIQATLKGDSLMEHHHLFRGALATTGTTLAPTAFGEVIGTSNIAANSEFSKTYSVNLDPSWVKANLEAYVVIYKIKNGRYQVVNVEKAKKITTGIDNLKGIEKASIYPNPAVNSATLSISATEAKDVAIRITDILGRNVYVAPSNKIKIGANSFNIPLNNMSTGLYNVEISSNEGRIVERLSVEK